MLNELVELVEKGERLYVEVNNANAALLLALHLARKLGYRVTSEIAVPPQLTEAFSDIEIHRVEGCFESDNTSIIVFDAQCEPRLYSNAPIVVSIRRYSARFKNRVRVYIRRVDVSRYLALVNGKAFFVKISLDGIQRLELDRDLAKAMNVLNRALLEYGTLTVRDATNVLCAELGVDRRRARMLMQKLVALRLYNIEGGHVVPTISIVE